MTFFAIYAFVFFLLIRNRCWMLYVWVAASPIISNLIAIRNDNPFFGSYRIVDYVGYSSGPARHINELFSFDRIVLILLLLVVMKAIRSPADPLVARVQRWLGLLALTVFISALFSHNVINALRKATDTFGLCYLAFIIGRTYAADRRVWSQFLNSMLVLGVVLGCTCVIEYQKFGDWNLNMYGDAHRVAGPFRYWETLGMAVSLVAFVAWYKWVTATGRRVWLKHAVYLAIGILMAYCVFRTQTRTIMLALAAGAVVVLYSASGAVMSRSLVRKLVLAVLLGGIFLLVSPEWLTSTRFFQSTVARQQTKEGRMETYVAAMRMFLQNPIMGIGLKNFQDDMRLYVSANDVSISSLEKSTCHSSYLVTAAECGLMGLIPLVGFIVTAFGMCRKYVLGSIQPEDKAWGVAMLGMTVAYFYCGTSFDPFFDPTMQNQLYCMCLGSTAARLDALQNAT